MINITQNSTNNGSKKPITNTTSLTEPPNTFDELPLHRPLQGCLAHCAITENKVDDVAVLSFFENGLPKEHHVDGAGAISAQSLTLLYLNVITRYGIPEE